MQYARGAAPWPSSRRGVPGAVNASRSAPWMRSPKPARGMGPGTPTGQQSPRKEGPVTRVIHPIEQRSYEILRARADTSALPPLTRAVVERVIHASADLGYLDDLVCAEPDLAAGAQALRDGAPVVADSPMPAAGVTARDV